MSDAPPNSANDAVGRALGSLDHLLDVLHDKVLRPIILIGRTVAYGFVVVLVGLVVIVAAVIATVRLLDVYAWPGLQWLTYLLIGAVLVAAGLLLWRQRRPARLRK